MKTQLDAYGVCQRYLRDHRTILPEAIYKRVEGNLRARNISFLASASSNFDRTLYSVDTYRILMQIEAFFKKNADLDNGIDCEAVALESFMDSENLCAVTNRRLDHFYLEHDHYDPDLKLKIQRAETYIRRVLGDFDKFMEEIPERLRVTSGATATRSRKNSLPYMKVHGKVQCTPSAYPYIRATATYFGYATRPDYIIYNRVITVPKNWKTDRTIACEPAGNLPFQLAFDSFAKDRLRKFGIDLGDQSVNQRAAHAGSIDGSICTVDLSAASDTIAFNTVALLLPQKWFQYLNAIRSGFYKLGDSLNRYEKFSSMGNGATFALETLIFAACCHAVGSKSFNVYGDDIVLENHLYDDLEQLLNFLGFKVNADKSFRDGPYRESCGDHYVNGQLVTPFFLRSLGRSKAELCHIVNGLLAIGKPYGFLWEYCRSIIREAELPLVPYNMSTMSGIFIDVTSAYKRKLLAWNRKHRQMTEFKAYIPKGTEAVNLIHDSRALFLYYLQSTHVDRDSIPWWTRRLTTRGLAEYLRSVELKEEASRIEEHVVTKKYVRRWMPFYPLSYESTPSHIYCVSDWLEPR